MVNYTYNSTQYYQFLKNNNAINFTNDNHIKNIKSGKGFNKNIKYQKIWY